MLAHTSKDFENELESLRAMLLAMGARSQAQVASAMQALTGGDAALALQVVASDDAIDRDELAVDELAHAILAKRQPVASDLRFIVSALKIVVDLERIGDLAANIAKRAADLQDPARASADFGPLAERVQASFHDALAAFGGRDPERAAELIEADREIDRLNAALFQTLITRVVSDPASAPHVIPATSIARSLERIGDHAKNIAESVVYMVRGRDVRHRHARR